MTDGAANRYYSASWKGGASYRAVTTADISANSGTSSTQDNQAPSTTCAILQTTALKANHSAATLIAVGIGTDTNNQVINKTYNTNLDASYATGTMSISQILSAISQSITTDVNSNASIVTDPMSLYVTFDSFRSPATPNPDEASVSPVGGVQTLSWDLSKATPVTTTSTSGSTTITTKVYTLTYRVTVNRTAAFYTAVQNSTFTDKGVATNGTTTLPYTLGDTSGTLTFDVPRVTSVMPTLNYTIEYYKQGTATAGDYANYTQSDTNTGVASLFAPVAPPSGYETKYSAASYHYASGDPASITISLTGTNTIKLYYNRDTTSVTVNHYYKLTTTNRDGTVTVGEYPTTPNTVTTNSNVYVGDPYTADLQTSYGGVTYTLDSSKPNNQTIGSLSATADSNIINLYYTGTLDNRVDVNYSVDHVYRTHTWTLVDGTYQLVNSSVTVPNVQTGTQKAHTVYTVTDPQPVAGNGDFTYDTSSVNSITLQENSDNKITLYFDKTVDPRVAIDVTVNHHYTKTVKTIVNGQIQTTVDPNDHVETVTAHKYVGESYTASQVNAYNGDAYTSDPGNAGKLSVSALNSTNNVIDLYYTILDEPGETTVTVNHIYRTITHATVAVTDENGNITGTTVQDSTNVDDTQTAQSPSLYVGQSYTASMVGRTGYTFNAAASGSLTVAAAAGNASVINLYYDNDVNTDNRDAASINVQHVYTTHLTTIQNGAVTPIDVSDGSVTDQATSGKAGDSFAAQTETTYNGNTYTVVGTPALQKALQPGTNSTIVINYERSDSNLVAANYTVNYVYKTYTMTVGANGVAGYLDDPTSENGTPLNASGYVGQIISNIPDGARDGFSVEGTNPATTLTLAEQGNTLTFTYAKYVPLAQVSVAVNHHYTTKTIAENGTSTTDTSNVAGVPVNKYTGETFEAAALLNGFDLDHYTVTDGITATQDAITKSVTVTASGNVVVDFYYTKTIDNSVPANYSIQHIYNTYGWDGTLIGTSSPNPVTGTGYVTNQISATPDNQQGAYTLVSATCNGAVLESPYTVNLSSGNNAIVFTYEKHVDNRQATSVKVIHNYYARDTYTTNPNVSDADFIASATPEYTTENVITSFDDGVWVGHSYTAAQVLTYDTHDYRFFSADPADQTIASLALATDENANPNVITMNYIRDTSSDPGDAVYSVVHQYYLDGQLVGTVNGGEVSAKIGTTVNSSDVARQYTYDGRTYSFSGAAPTSLVISSNPEANMFTLTYSYTTGGGGGGDDSTSYYYRIDYVYTGYGADGAKIYSDAATGSVQSVGMNNYSFTAAATASHGGYDFALTGDPAMSANLNGTSRSDPYVFTVNYEFTELNNGNPPLSGTPGTGAGTGTAATPGQPTGTDIPEEGVPLADANVPQTGDPLAAWVALASVSGLGLVLLAITGRKRREENQ